MKITVIGTGYVGLVTGACLADMGNDVLCLDVDAGKVQRLRDGIIPIYEPGLEGIVRRNADAGRLRFTTDPQESVRFGEIQMIAVGTPPGEDGSADLQYVLAAASTIAQHMDEYRLVVDKSTVPVGTADRVEARIREVLQQRGVDIEFSVASNPEFLKEGAAVDDFLKPDRIVLGVSDERAEALLRELYQPFQRNHERTIVMGRRSAELTKYAANAMLATRISFMNDLARLAERVGVDIEDVRRGIGSDSRIGYSFLYAGTGYGGSCFPKDVQALQRTAQEHGAPLRVLRAVEDVNNDQKSTLVRKASDRFGSLSGRRFALWGLAFKPNTDDMREAPARTIMEALWAAGASVVAYDPIAADECRRIYGDRPDLVLAASPLEAVRGADALMIATEWKEFRSPSFDEMRDRLKHPVIFDGRNLYDPALVRGKGFEYFSVGRS
ncbi:MAG: UDP-glucose/GDP-mannose dehydrogenase family protein [Burkholderiales bacterium]|nr:UDP-glucose/GDP-mannose dehydrogenase family protein [Burkholderiales bacterium]